MRRRTRALSSSAARPRISTQKDLWIPGLIRHYAMERISGSTIYDETGAGNGTVVNMTTGPGVAGVGLIGGSVASVERHIDMGNEIVFTSFSLWFRRLDTTQIGCVLFNGGADKTVQIREASAGNLLGCYNGSWVYSDHVVADTGWHHLAAVLESGTNLRFWLDGRPATSTVNLANNTFRYIGRRYTISGQEAVCFDQFRLFNSPLSYQQIRSLFDELR